MGGGYIVAKEWQRGSRAPALCGLTCCHTFKYESSHHGGGHTDACHAGVVPRCLRLHGCIRLKK